MKIVLYVTNITSKSMKSVKEQSITRHLGNNCTEGKLCGTDATSDH